MRPDLHLIDAVRRAQTLVFKQHLTLRRAEHGVRLVLEDRADTAARAANAAKAAHVAPQDALRAQVRSELAALLDAQPGARRVMRHLVFVEGALARAGLGALGELPLPVLERALEQFEGLVSNWSPVGLATLRSKMAVAIAQREHLPPQLMPDTCQPTFPADLDAANALPEAEECSDTAVLTAVYAALGGAAPGTAEPEPARVAAPLAALVDV